MKGSIKTKQKRSYRRSNITVSINRKQVAMLSEVSFMMTFKRSFFAKLTRKELTLLYKLGAGLYTLGLEAAGGEVK